MKLKTSVNVVKPDHFNYDKEMVQTLFEDVVKKIDTALRKEKSGRTYYGVCVICNELDSRELIKPILENIVTLYKDAGWVDVQTSVSYEERDIVINVQLKRLA